MIMDERGTLRSIAWQQIFPGLRLFAAIRMALNFKALLLGAVAMAGMVAGSRVIDQIEQRLAHGGHEVVRVEAEKPWPWETPLEMAPAERLTSPGVWYSYSPLLTGWNELSTPFRRMLSINEATTFPQFMYCLAYALWSLIVWSFFGGAISRQAAVSFARQENVSLGQLARFVHGRWSGYFVAPLLPLLGAGLVAALLAAVGLVMRLEVGIFVASLIWPLVLLGGFIMAFLLLGLFFGFPLMWGAVSAEGTDAFGALSHAYSYVYQRPLRYLCYVVIAGAAGVLGWYLVTLFSHWIVDLSRWGVSWGTGEAHLAQIEGYETMGRIADNGSAIILFWNNCLNLLGYSFIFSYFWTSTTVIYFLLRRLVDATQLDEVFMPGEQSKNGLPPIKMGADGVPSVADEPPPAAATSESAPEAESEG